MDKKFFSFRGVLTIIFLSIIKYFFIANDYEMMLNSVLTYRISLREWGMLVLIMFITLVFHEFAHAMACNFYGGNVKKMGVLLYFLFPAFYCDVSDIYIIAKRKASFIVGISGICANLLVGNIAVLFYYLSQKQYPIFLYIWFANVGITVYNLLPIVKLDGYWVLSSILDMTNLMDKAVIIFITSIFDNKNLPKAKSLLKRVFLCVYGGSVFIVRPSVWLYTGVEMRLILLRCGFATSIANIIMLSVILILIIDEVKLIIRYIKLYNTNKFQLLQMI